MAGRLLVGSMVTEKLVLGVAKNAPYSLGLNRNVPLAICILVS